MCEFLCHCTLLFWLSLQGDYEVPKLVLFFSLYMDEPHGENTRDKFLFWFSLQDHCEGFQKEFYSFQLHELITWTEHEKQTFVSV